MHRKRGCALIHVPFLSQVEAAVLAEIRDVIGTKPITMELVQQLRYLKAVLQETLRLYPPGKAVLPVLGLWL